MKKKILFILNTYEFMSRLANKNQSTKKNYEMFNNHDKAWTNYFYNNLKKNYFKINKIKAFYYFEVGRWDIALKDNRVIKLPEVDYEKVLMQVDVVLNDSNFSKYKIFDYRIKDQLILQ